MIATEELEPVDHMRPIIVIKQDGVFYVQCCEGLDWELYWNLAKRYAKNYATCECPLYVPKWRPMGFRDIIGA